jgi:hypothetical protein
MTKGYSLCIGVNSVDPNHYADGNGNPWEGKLDPCENDAKVIQDIAKSQNFEVNTLLTKQATIDNVLKGIKNASDKLEDGDIFMIYYSGHGGQMLDENADEIEIDKNDLYDETWCLYDGELIDDYIYAALSNFKPGVRILSFSDSCHSGTVIKNAIPKGISAMDKNEIKLPQYGNVNPVTSNVDKTHKSILKYAPLDVLIGTYKKNKEFYNSQRKNAPTIDSKNDVKASAILISGCQDFQTSAAPFELENSLFTDILLKVWDQGSFHGNYKSFCGEMKNKLPSNQVPNYFPIGTKNEAFENQKPFTI